MIAAESEYLHFEEDDHYEGKTKRIYVISRRLSIVLGEIRWWPAWRQYTFVPEGETVWNRTCLDDVQHVIDQLMKDRNENINTSR